MNWVDSSLNSSMDDGDNDNNILVKGYKTVLF